MGHSHLAVNGGLRTQSMAWLATYVWPHKARNSVPLLGTWGIKADEATYLHADPQLTF